VGGTVEFCRNRGGRVLFLKKGVENIYKFQEEREKYSSGGEGKIVFFKEKW